MSGKRLLAISAANTATLHKILVLHCSIRRCFEALPPACAFHAIPLHILYRRKNGNGTDSNDTYVKHLQLNITVERHPSDRDVSDVDAGDDTEIVEFQ